MNRNATTTLGSCNICDIRVDRKKIDAVQLVIKYDEANNEVFIRDNRTESGTFQVNTSSALDQNVLYNFSLANQTIKLKTGKNINIEIVALPEQMRRSRSSSSGVSQSVSVSRLK